MLPYIRASNKILLFPTSIPFQIVEQVPCQLPKRRWNSKIWMSFSICLFRHFFRRIEKEAIHLHQIPHLQGSCYYFCTPDHDRLVPFWQTIILIYDLLWSQILSKRTAFFKIFILLAFIAYTPEMVYDVACISSEITF